MTNTTTEEPEATEDALEAPAGPTTPDPAEDAGEPQDDPEDGTQEEPETFDRTYVEKLRREAAEQRVKAKRADDLATALWTAQVTASGRLADPTDLAMPDDADPTDAEAVTAAIDELLARKPHLASRRPVGNVGQGEGDGKSATVDLAALMRPGA